MRPEISLLYPSRVVRLEQDRKLPPLWTTWIRRQAAHSFLGPTPSTSQCIVPLRHNGNSAQLCVKVTLSTCLSGCDNTAFGPPVKPRRSQRAAKQDGMRTMSRARAFTVSQRLASKVTRFGIVGEKHDGDSRALARGARDGSRAFLQTRLRQSDEPRRSRIEAS